ALQKRHQPLLVACERRAVIPAAIAQLANQQINLCHRQYRALPRHEGNTGRGIADQRRTPFCPAIQSDLAGPVEINAANARQGREDLRALPADLGKDVRQYRFAFLVVRGALGGQVLVTKKEEKERLVLAHGEAIKLSSRNPVAEIDE